MADDMQRLVVALEARTKSFENALNKANGVANSRARAIESRFARMNKNVSHGLEGVGKAFAAAFISRAAIRGMVSLTDTATRIDNALKVTGLSGEALEGVFNKLTASAIRNGAPIESLVTLYGRASLAQKELGVTNEELITLADNVGKALRVQGTSAEAAQGALLQLGQAFSTGVVRAEEYNSLQEGAPALLRAVAAGLKETGGSVGKLTNLVKSGEVSSEAFFRALEAGAGTLDTKVANSTFTLEQATNNLYTALVKVAREFNNATGTGAKFAGAINSAADAINGFDVSGFIQKLRDAKSELDGFLQDVGNAQIFKDLAEQLGVLGSDGALVKLDKTDAEQKAAELQREVEMLQAQIALNTELGFDNTDALARVAEVRAAIAALDTGTDQFAGGLKPVSSNFSRSLGKGGTPEQVGPRVQTVVKPVSLDDFKPPAKPTTGGGGKSKESEYAREVEQIRERTAALTAETAAQATLNPLVDDYGFAMEKVRAEQDLLAAAQKAGLQVTPELRASISQLAEGYAQASVEAKKLAENQDAVREAAEDFKQTGKDVMSGFISDLRSGKSASEALANALNKVADKLLDVALNSAFGIGKTGGSGGGFLGSILGGIGKFLGFAQGGYTGSGGKNEPAGIVHKGEYVMDAATTKRIGVRNLRKLQGYSQGGLVGSAPTLPAMAPTRQQGGGAIAVSVTTEVQNGNLVPLVTAVAGQVAGQQIKQVNRNIQGRLRTVSSRGV